MKRTVRVYEVTQEITVYQKSKSVWLAIGDCMGKPLEVKSSSASSAAKLWQETAHYWGNVGEPPPAVR